MVENSNKGMKSSVACEKCNEYKYEIGVLRRQIDNLNLTSLNIKKQNHALEVKLEELSKTNENLMEIQKEKNELFAVIVHDIKNPTTIIKSLVELLRTYDTNNADQQAIIDDLVVSTKQVVALSQEISKVLTLEGTTVQMFREFSNPGILIKEVVSRNTINAKNKNQTISIDIEDDIPQFSVDVVKICEVFDNIISNAIKYTNPGGKIGVRCRKISDMIQFEFSDTGLGISEDDLKKAFQRGVKLSAKPTGGETSSGLGLWIVKKIVEAHKGKIWIKSSLGVGSVFTIQIPIAAIDDTDDVEV